MLAVSSPWRRTYRAREADPRAPREGRTRRARPRREGRGACAPRRRHGGRLHRAAPTSRGGRRGRDPRHRAAPRRREERDARRAVSTALEAWSWPARFDESYRPAADEPYWFRRRETMPAAEREHAIVSRIREVMRYAWERAPFYRRKWADAGIGPDDVRSLEDFERVPVVRKEELRRA